MKVAILGTGKMGSALAAGIARGKKARLILCDHSHKKALQAAKKCRARAEKSARAAAKASDIIIIAVKPGAVEELLSGIKEGLHNKLVLSIAAGLPISCLKKCVPTDCRVAVAMPNLAAEIGKGTAIFFASSEKDAKAVHSLLSPTGAVVRAKNEEDIDFGFLTSSGMAFFLAAMEGMAKAGEKHGLTYEQALTLSAKAAEGAGALVLEHGIKPLDLEKMVATKKGITLHGLQVLRRAKVQKHFHNAAHAVIKEAKKRRQSCETRLRPFEPQAQIGRRKNSKR